MSIRNSPQKPHLFLTQTTEYSVLWSGSPVQRHEQCYKKEGPMKAGMNKEKGRNRLRKSYQVYLEKVFVKLCP